ncbi:MAG: peroxide stress protein YaaA [Bacillota bacterium]|nr:peroxide stress protein YaaA [Bacillota bacterium]
MKIIFSPSKEMIFKNSYKEQVNFLEKTSQIINVLRTLDINELKSSFKISAKVLEEVEEYIKDFYKEESFKAIEMYNGLSFRWLDVWSLDKEARLYLEDQVKILSALYGPLSPETLIRPYRLDFNTSLKIDNKSLKNFWKEDYGKSFEKGEVIINLASNEFSSLLNRKDFIFYDFEFFEEGKGKLKSHSTISKKARGLMLRYLALNQITDLEKIKSFNLDSYSYRADLSEDRKFVFVKRL